MATDVPRAERAAEAAKLRARGLTQQQIAERMGISLSYANALLTDPDGSRAKARKASYSGVCLNCGRRTSGANGRDKAPQLCAGCAAERDRGARWWTPERVIDAIHLWVSEKGQQPLSGEWHDGDHRGSRFPSTSTVLREFGTWANAMEAAGCIRTYVGWRTAEGRERVIQAARAGATWTAERIEALLLGFAAEHGRLPTCNEMAAWQGPRYETAVRYLGPLSAFALRHRLPVNAPYVTRSRVNVERYANGLDIPPELRRAALPGDDAYQTGVGGEDSVVADYEEGA